MFVLGELKNNDQNARVEEQDGQSLYKQKEEKQCPNDQFGQLNLSGKSQSFRLKSIIFHNLFKFWVDY